MRRGVKKSIVWEFFTKVIVDGKVTGCYCNVCNSSYKFSGNTSNLREHLKRVHPVQFGEQDHDSTGKEMLEKDNPKKSIVFAAVKQACVDLVKKHGHPITLIDEEAFRSLIQLMPMTLKQKARITAEYIQKCVDVTAEDEDAEKSVHEASDSEDEAIIIGKTITVKGEIEEVPCHCDARVTEGGTKSHQVGCPAAARQPYWNYFEVSMEEATCHICHLTLGWTNISKLKEHLIEKHPTAQFVDDGQEFTRGPASDVWSHEETEEIYLEDLEDDPLPPVSSRKRKRTSERLESRDERPEKEKEKSREEMMREMRREREAVSAARMRMKDLEPERFKSLDSFGQYVAELMKLIPKDKCLKYQVQIVQRLLQEQAAAG